MNARPGLPFEELHEFAEDALAQLERRASMAVSIAQDALDAGWPAVSLYLGTVGGHLEPPPDQRFVRLQVKLQPVSALAMAKRLIGARAGPCQVHRALGQVEGVGMPLEYVLDGAEMAKQRIGGRPGHGVEAVPADLADRIGAHVGAKRRGEELRAEADAEHGNF